MTSRSAQVPASVPAAVRAFDSMAARFDERFGSWRSVCAQRGAVRDLLVSTFPPGARLLELGGGTGEDALFLADVGRTVHLTDGAPAMVQLARDKVRRGGADAAVTVETLLLEEVEAWASALPVGAFDGAYSNFAALNCVTDLAPVARGLARAVAPGGSLVLVVFGGFSPGEVVTELLRGRPRAAFRRLRRGDTEARLGGERFSVRYPGRSDFARAFAPWFDLSSARGIGVFVPPSAAEPWISRHPGLLRALARLDQAVSAPLASFGDHVAYIFDRTPVPAPAGATST